MSTILIGGNEMSLFDKVINKLNTFKCECGGLVKQVNYNETHNFECTQCTKQYTVK